MVTPVNHLFGYLPATYQLEHKMTMQSPLLFLLLLLVSGTTLWSQHSLRDSREIPFEMVKNAIVIPVQIDGTTYRFVLDTGGYLLISQRLREEGGFPLADSIIISDANAQEQVFEKVKLEAISIGALTFNDREAIVDQHSGMYPNSCFETDGMIGRDFFDGMILHFDYEKGIMRLTENPSVVQLKEQHHAKMRISKRGLPDVQLRINGKNRYIEFDSGSGDFFSYQSRQAEKLKVKTAKDKLTFKGIFSFGVSSSQRIEPDIRYKAKVYDLQLGSTNFTNFYSNFSKATAPRIGAGMLYFGKVTVDFQKNAFYFEPYRDAQKPTTLGSFGFDIVYLNGEYLIKWVLEGSEAERSGLTFGLKIKSINGQPVEDVAKACEGYINGYIFKNQESVSLEYYDAAGYLQSITLNKEIYE